MLLVPVLMPKHELVLLPTPKMTVTVAIQESGLVQEGTQSSPLRIITQISVGVNMTCQDTRPAQENKIGATGHITKTDQSLLNCENNNFYK